MILQFNKERTQENLTTAQRDPTKKKKTKKSPSRLKRRQLQQKKKPKQQQEEQRKKEKGKKNKTEPSSRVKFMTSKLGKGSPITFHLLSLK